jgi:hypothetical protein
VKPMAPRILPMLCPTVCDQRQRPLFSCAHDSRPKVESSKVLTAKREASADPISVLAHAADGGSTTPLDWG